MPHRKIVLTPCLAFLFALCLSFATATCAESTAGSTDAPETTMPKTRVELSTTQGDFVVEVDPNQAPKTVANFLTYVREGFYDGTIFHRVIPGFMIQGGGFNADMRQKPTGGPVVNEADNGLTNRRGTVAMARTGDPHSATAQFFVNLVDNTPLDHTDKSPRGWGYTVFGEVVEGMEVVDAIAGVATGSTGPHRDVPREPVIIEKARVLEEEAAGES